MRTPVVKAMVVIRRPRDGAVLVSGDVDTHGSAYERPLGGHVDFGERAADCARRELREEIGQDLGEVRLLGVLENLFTLGGQPGHEIVFVLGADFVDPSAYEIESQAIRDDATGRVRVRWRGIDEHTPPLVPAGIERYLGDGSAEMGSAGA